MNFDAFWQANRRFLTGAAIGVLVFLLGRAIIGRTAGAEVAAHERSIRASSRDLGDFHVPANEVNRAEAALRELQARALDLARLALQPDAADPAFAEFRPSAGESPSRHYIEFSGRRRQELVGLALLNDVDLDESLGLPAESPTQPLAIERTLRGFYIVDQVVRLAVDFGARRVEDIRIELRRKARKDQALELAPVSIDVLLEEDRLDAFLGAVLHPSQALGFVGMEVLPLDKKNKLRRVNLRFEAAVLPVEPAGQEDLP